MFKEGDIIVPSMNNMETVFEKPVPQYRICEISMGRVWAEDIRTGEITDVGPMRSTEYYYTAHKAESEDQEQTKEEEQK